MCETGNLSVLNVGAGDIRVTFNNTDRGEIKKAVGMLTDMMARGYAVLVELPDGSYTRVTEVDASRGRYVITLPDDVQDPPDAEVVKPRRGRPKGKKGRTISVPVRTSRAVGVARSAGG